MAQELNWFASKPEHENVGLALAADSEAYRGHLGKSRDLTRRALESAIRADSKENGAIWQVNFAVMQAAFGDPAEAKLQAAAALKLAPSSPGAEAEAALAFAMSGDSTHAESLAQDLQKRFPLDTQMQSLLLPAIHGQLALNKKNPAAAISSLQDQGAIELGAFPFSNNVSCLYQVYIRGEAYLAGGQASAAANEFQKILDHSGIVEYCWTGALAHLGVGRASAGRKKFEGSRCGRRASASAHRLQRFSRIMERRRRRNSNSARSKVRIREASIIPARRPVLSRYPRITFSTASQNRSTSSVDV